MSVAKEYLRKCEYTVEDVSRKPGHKGYDLLATRGNETIKIEVNGCTSPWGIPIPM